MTRKGYDGLSALVALRGKLDAFSCLEVIHENGHCWKAHFTFNEPATREDLEAVKRQVQLPLSPTYEQFLLHCDGALLYYDDEYGQWGFHLYGTQELFLANEQQKDIHEDWPLTYLTFAESFGDADILVFDVAQPVENDTDYRVLDGDSADYPREWVVAAPSFGDWLDRLVVAQGAKYWRWYR